MELNEWIERKISGNEWIDGKKEKYDKEKNGMCRPGGERKNREKEG